MSIVIWYIFGILLLLFCALCFIIPPIYLNSERAGLSHLTCNIYAWLLVLPLILFSSLIYYNIGSYAAVSREQGLGKQGQKNSKHTQEVYAILQRNLIKYELDIPINNLDLELILAYAKLHSQAENGILHKDVKTLLLGILKSIPTQITALNLLAIDAYKQKNYTQAINNWQKIINQMDTDKQNVEVYTALNAKIREINDKLANQKSINQQ